MYDPDLNVWTRKNDFPGSVRTYACSFISGGNCFLGTGLGLGIYLSDIWKYNASGDTWSKVADMPNGRYKAAVFSINDKVYIGYGMSGPSTQQYDFYKFDPSGL
jgi:N-acetylneuraminic acid mutarotase